MTPINASTVTQAVEKMLLAATNELDITVTRAEVVNEKPNDCPWVGIYRTEFDFPFHTLGAGSASRQQRLGLLLIAQQSHPNSGADCEVLLENLIQWLLATLTADETLGGNVDILDQVKVVYQNYLQVDSAYMQTAFIYLVAISSGG